MSMDVTFHESESFFLQPQLSLQGEQRCVEEISGSPLMIIEMEKPQKPKEVENERVEEVEVENERVEVENERMVERAPETARVEDLKENKLLVYSRGTWSKRKDPTETTASPLPLPFSLSDEDSSGNSNTDTPSLNDLNVPIAIQKGVRSCSQHLISNFVSYSHLSSSY